MYFFVTLLENVWYIFQKDLTTCILREADHTQNGQMFIFSVFNAGWRGGGGVKNNVNARQDYKNVLVNEEREYLQGFDANKL